MKTEIVGEFPIMSLRQLEDIVNLFQVLGSSPEAKRAAGITDFPMSDYEITSTERFHSIMRVILHYLDTCHRSNFSVFDGTIEERAARMALICAYLATAAFATGRGVSLSVNQDSKEHQEMVERLRAAKDN